MIPFLRLGIEVPRTKFPFRIMRSTLFLFSQLVLFLCRCRVHFLHFEMLHFVSPLFPLFKVFSIKFAFISYTFISNGALIPDLGSASDWLNQISHAAQPIRSTTQIWVVTRHQYGISALVSQTSFGGETSGSVAKCRLFSQAKKQWKNKHYLR